MPEPLRGADDPLPDLLATGERAAFHGRPGDGVEPLIRAVTVAAAGGRAAEADAATWLLAVCLVAAGRYGAALVRLQPLVAGPPAEPERRLFAALAAATLASLHRQLGRHAAALDYDRTAAGWAGAAAEAAFDADLGLAADAVGLGAAADARTALLRAQERLAGRPDWWRQRVRAGWVAAELALLLDDPAAAESAARAAVAEAEAADAPRHVAKSLLFAGVAAVQAGRTAAAVPLLRRGARLAEQVGALPLVWPGRAVLATVLAADDPAEALRCRTAARDAVDVLLAGLPADLAREWRARPDVAAVLDSAP